MRRLIATFLAFIIFLFVSAAFVVPLLPAGGAEETELAGYQGSSTAVVVRVFPSFPGLAVADPPFQADSPHTVVTLSTGPATFARSSIFWPGDLLAHMGSIFQQAAPQAGFIPNYPVRAEAASPGGTSHLEAGGGLFSMDAKAEPNEATATGAGAGSGVPGVLTVTASQAMSKTTFTSALASMESKAVVEGVNILNGLITAESITSLATASTNGSVGKGGGSTQLVGLKIQNISAVIDENGVRAADRSQPIPDPDKQINDALSASGVQIQVLGPSEKVEGAGVNRLAAGLLVRIPLPSTVAQVKGASLTIALAMANAGVNSSTGLALPNFELPIPELTESQTNLLPPGVPLAAPGGAPPAVTQVAVQTEATTNTSSQEPYVFGGVSVGLVALVVIGSVLVAGFLVGPFQSLLPK